MLVWYILVGSCASDADAAAAGVGHDLATYAASRTRSFRPIEPYLDLFQRCLSVKSEERCLNSVEK